MREAAREAETGGADSVGAQVHVAEPWAGYDEMRLDEVLARLQDATEVELAIVAAYEREHEAREPILLAAGARLGAPPHDSAAAGPFGPARPRPRRSPSPEGQDRPPTGRVLLAEP